ncbi:hypothetical protein LSTR_LSTR002908 [Laodelphax striatellus]|uniref:Uncharacterized protein n=1 Tax=Laodelphax striatellus TaxID=195883 RepID=A0A482XKX9_LAOST|nr:hypothetical protein LSTR_LSTR002908 [Laodelphax striatellus]
MKLRVLLTVFLFAAALASDAPLTPQERVARLLNDKYFRSPTVALLESSELSLTRAGVVWSRVAPLISPHNKDYHILVASFNNTDLARPVEARSAWDVQESARFMAAKIRKLKTNGAAASEMTEDFGAMQALERIATSNWLPYDGCLMLFTAFPPTDSNNTTGATQALILRRTKLFVVWLKSDEAPEVYKMVAQQTGGEILETNWTPDNNQTTDHETEDAEIFVERQQEQQKLLLKPTVENVQREVLLAMRQGARGKSVLTLPVDSSIDEMEVKITGRLDTAFLRKPSGEPLALVNASDGQRIKTGGELGPWRLDTSGTLYDVTVLANSRLAYDVIPPLAPPNTNISQGVSFKLKKLRGEGKLEKVTLIDETGKALADLENLSATRRQGGIEEPRFRFPTNEEEENAEKGENGEERIANPAGDTEWLIPVDRLPSKQYFVQVDGRNAKGEPFRRLSALSVAGGDGWGLTPVLVEVSERSQLSARSGQTVQLYFDVVSFHFRPLAMSFYAQDDRAFIRNVNPTRALVYPQTKIQVAVIMEVQGINQDKDTIALTAESIVGPVTGKAYLYTNNQRSEDTAKPDISITTEGYCRDYLSPQVCYSKFWRIDANIRDSNGLLRIRSVPLGLEYKNEFIAGTMEEVRVHYQSTCCNTRVDIIAIDIYGNINAKTVDIEKVWLTAGEISAIVLGSILAVLLLILLIVAIVFCVRRRRSHNFIMHR